jgi:threonine aldolase
MPTEEMIMAMREAPVGDDVYGEDPMVNAFEREITYLTGKEAALFCVSATMANALAVRSLLDGSPPHSIICDARAHVYRWEAGNVALLSQASTIPTHAKNGLYVTGEEIEAEAWEKGDVHSAPTRVVSLENTVNGVIMPLEEMA